VTIMEAPSQPSKPRELSACALLPSPDPKCGWNWKGWSTSRRAWRCPQGRSWASTLIRVVQESGPNGNPPSTASLPEPSGHARSPAALVSVGAAWGRSSRQPSAGSYLRAATGHPQGTPDGWRNHGTPLRATSA
jgi:hypothetical protein